MRPSRLYMKIKILTITILLIFTIVSADELSIPYSCYPKALQEKFAEHNLRLELDPSERTKDSWAYLKNEGAKYIIFTYKSVTQEELNLVLRIAQEVEIEQNRR